MPSTEAAWVPSPPEVARKTKKEEERKGKKSICGPSGLYPAAPFSSCFSMA